MSSPWNLIEKLKNLKLLNEMQHLLTQHFCEIYSTMV